MIKSNFELEKSLLEKGYQFVFGVDEAGRGPLAGPVVACAAIAKNYQMPENDKNFAKSFDLIRDSKLLSAKQRENIFDFILENFFVGIGMCDHHTIDRMNILEASFLAMKKATSELIRIMNDELRIKYEGDKKIFITHNSESIIILVDGNKKIPNFSMEQKAVVNGDKFIKSISAASIIAKVVRDRIMLEMHAKFPNYGFDKHKGYGTKLHVENLQQFGPCAIHRKSFEPVKSLVKRRK
jgi:ribonuclease HII